jgi:hypothetical protein
MECDERARFTAVLTARHDGRTQAAAAGQSTLTARFGGSAASRTVTVMASCR